MPRKKTAKRGRSRTYNKANKTRKSKNTRKIRHNKILTKRNREYRKSLENIVALTKKYKEYEEKQQKTVPGLGIAVKIIKDSIKQKKIDIKTAKNLLVAIASLATFSTVQPKLDTGSLGTLVGPIGSDTNTLVKYGNPGLNAKKDPIFSNRELKTLKRHLPQLYTSITGKT